MIVSEKDAPLDAAACRLLARTLGESPSTALTTHGLLSGACRAYILGAAGAPRAALVEVAELPGEPQGFAADSDSLWELLKHVCGWDCVLVCTELARGLGERIAEERGRPVRYYGDVGYVLTKPATLFPHPAVRQLEVADLPLLQAAAEELRVGISGDVRELLSAGLIAAAVIDGRLVARAHALLPLGKYADIGVHTLAPWRGQGLATAAAGLVARRIQELGKTPIWSAGEGNVASLCVARKLGFEEAYRQLYVIPS